MGAGGFDAGRGFGDESWWTECFGWYEMEVYGDYLCAWIGLEDGAGLRELGELLLGC